MWRRSKAVHLASDPDLRAMQADFVQLEVDERRARSRQRRATLWGWTWPPLVTAGVGVALYGLGLAEGSWWFPVLLTYGVACGCAGVVILDGVKRDWKSGKPPPPHFTINHAIAIPGLAWCYFWIAVGLVFVTTWLLITTGILPWAT